MITKQFTSDAEALESAVELSVIYAEMADELRIALQKPGLSRDQLARLVVLGSVQLDNASETVDRLARIARLPEIEDDPMMARQPSEQSRMAGQWEHQARAEIRRARWQGFLLGVGSLGWAIALCILMID